MARAISSAARERIVVAAQEAGFRPTLRADGTDAYRKNLMFTAPDHPYPVFVRKEGGPVSDHGEPAFLQVAVHPEAFSANLIDQAGGIEEMINTRTGQNRFSNSNYRGFPYYEGNNEPCARCYRVSDPEALRRLLTRLRSPAPVAELQAQPPLSPSRQTGPESGASRAPGLAIDTGLVIREPFITEILSGRKTWEMRSIRASRRGPIALIAKGTGLIRGVAKLVDVLPRQSASAMRQNFEKHRLSAECMANPETAKWRIPWVLEAPWELPQPVPYTHRSGAVTWAALDSSVSRELSGILSASWFG